MSILKSSLSRIADLVFLSLVAYTLIFLIIQNETFSSFFLFLSKSFNLLPKPIGFLLLGCIGFSLPIFLKKHNSYNINHTLINDFRNPPLYLASIFVILLSIFIHDELQELLHTSAMLAFTAGLFLCLCMMFMNNKKEEIHSDKSKISFDMKTWLEHEIPISNKNYDFLGFHAYIERISTLIEDNSKNKSHQIAIRGNFGSGKSSLCRLLEEKLTSSKSIKFIFCYVDGWGREDSSFAGQILEIVIDKLSEHTDCSYLIGVPESYINALNGSGLNSLVTATHLFSPTKKSDPESHLRKIDNLLTSIKSQMVITLEDFDRGHNPGQAANELGSLLERTKDLKNIHFLLCIKGENSTIIDKVCTHIEDIHEISTHASATLIKEFITYIEKEHSPEITFEAITYHFIPATNPLIRTPRSLKQALRRTATAWEKLKGEIDLINLLHFNILRFCQPDAFLFFLDNFEKLSSSQNEPAQNRGDAQKLLGTELEKLNLTRYEINGVKLLINSIFSGQYPVLNIDPSLHAELDKHKRMTSTRKMQRIGSFGNTNYLNRAISESIPNIEPKDQETLKWIDSYTSDQIQNELLKKQEKNIYNCYLENIFLWINSSEALANSKMQKIKELLIIEIDRLIPKNTPPFIDLYNTTKNPNYEDSAYVLIFQINQILKRNDYNGSSIYCDLKGSVIDHITSHNTSLAVYLSDQFCNPHDVNMYSKTIELLHKSFNEITYAKIIENSSSNLSFNSMALLYKLYTLVHATNADYSPHETEEINRFHEYLFNNGFIISEIIIPSLIFHLDHYNILDKSKILTSFEKNKLKTMVENFDTKKIKAAQENEAIVKLIHRWKQKIGDFIP